MNRIVSVVGVLAASAAWACSGEPCADRAAFSTIDGGVPVNLQPLVVRNVWFSTQANLAALKLLEADGGVVPSQVRVGYRGEVFAQPDTALTEGASYFLQYPTSCTPTDTHLEAFTVTAAADLSTPTLSFHVTDFGVAPIPQNAGAACAMAVDSSFANFRLDVDANRAELLPFLSWSLSLLPVDGGTPIAWSREPVGGVLADGGLTHWMNLQHAPPRLRQVWHLCDGVDAGFTLDRGAPAGTYRAELNGRYLGGDAGFVTLSEVFELPNCGTPSTGGGTGATGGGTGATGGGAAGGGTGATGGGGETGGSGCSTTALTLPLLALLAFRRRLRPSSNK